MLGKHTGNGKRKPHMCWLFNEGECSYGARCNFPNLCEVCQGSHPKCHCPSKGIPKAIRSGQFQWRVVVRSRLTGDRRMFCCGHNIHHIMIVITFISMMYLYYTAVVDMRWLQMFADFLQLQAKRGHITSLDFGQSDYQLASCTHARACHAMPCHVT